MVATISRGVLILMISSITAVGVAAFFIGSYNAYSRNSVSDIAQPSHDPSTPTDSLAARGKVEVVQYREGRMVFYSLYHNEITENGFRFISNQISGSNLTHEGSARFIALSTNATTADDDDLALNGEITSGGLARAEGVLSGIAS